uniref:Uncharacterized protein n=1 Tax=Nicotiana tabacum TaxID=4097 RepID=A0A1S4B663_TOBAC|nr:PREDICTED: uncharacterized protein LOC107804983 [Nicotiana tabacum]
MANVLQHQHCSMGSAHDMLKSFKEMFGEQNRAAKQTTMEALLNTKMAEGSSVRDHVLKMMGLLNELEVLGVVIDKKSQVEMEALVVALNVEKVSISKSKGGKKKKKAQKVLAPGGATGVKKTKGKCYHYSGATNHICTTLQGFQETWRLCENEVCYFEANGEPTPALALKDIRVSFNDYSKYGYIYLLRRKSECFEKLKELKTETEKRHDKYIKTLRTDRGAQLSAPGIPQQNGVAERRNITLLEMEEVNDIPIPQGVEDNIEASVQNDVVIQQQNPTAPVVTSRSGRIIKKPLRFALVGESYDRIPEEPST